MCTESKRSDLCETYESSVIKILADVAKLSDDISALRNLPAAERLNYQEWLNIVNIYLPRLATDVCEINRYVKELHGTIEVDARRRRQ